MQVMTREEGESRMWEAFEFLCAGKLTATEYAQIFFDTCEATTAHPVRRVVS